MDIVCRCTSCSAKFKVAEKFAGRKARCPKCQTVVEVSKVGSQTPTPPPDPSPAAAPPQPEQPQPLFVPEFPVLVTTPKHKSDKPAPASPPSKKKKASPLPLILAGGLGLLLLIGGGITAVLLLSGDSKPIAGKRNAKPPAGKAMLVLDWPGDRSNSLLTVDGKRLPIPPTGEITFPLGPGRHSLLLRRRGYEPIDETLALSAGEQRTYTPVWKQPSFAAAIPASTSSSSTAATPAASSGVDTPFVLGSGLSSAIKGFDAWQQNLEAAKRQAAAENKDVLIVLGSSDASPRTRALAAALADAEVKSLIASKFVPVIIDFPRTREGYNQVFDHAQNQALAEEFGIRELPAVALADRQAKPYVIEREWTDGFDDLKTFLETKQADRSQRDELLSATTAGDELSRVSAAETALKWLMDHKLGGAYEPEISQWLAMAERVDSENAAGKLEAFFEAQWMVNLMDIEEDDEFGLKAAVAAISPWISGRKFKDPDRGVRLHLVAASLLMKMDKQDDALVHLAKATTYEPKDQDLKEAVSGAKIALQNKDVLSTGTGFVISESGYVLTNHHVVEGEGKVVVRIPQTKETVPAEVIAEDPDRDMALLKVTFPASFKPGIVPVAAVEAGRGADVAAFGFPLGDSIGSGLKLTRGVVSAVPDESENNMILLDLRVNPGNSGGPLSDKRGNVIGMITAKTGGIGVDSYGMAIPAADLIKFLDTHLPESAARAVVAGDATAKEWVDVDKLVSPAVLMILKVK